MVLVVYFNQSYNGLDMKGKQEMHPEFGGGMRILRICNIRLNFD